MSKLKEIAKLDKLASTSFLLQVKQTLLLVVICKSNCKLCNSGHRFLSEKMYDLRKSLKQIHTYLVLNMEDISYKAVCNHFLQHYLRQKSNIRMKLYMLDLSKFQIKRLNRRKDLLDKKAMFNKMLLQVAAQYDTMNILLMRKTAASIKIFSDAIINVLGQLDMLDKLSQPVILVLEKLHFIIKEKSTNTLNQLVKKALTLVINELAHLCEGLWNTER